MRIIKCPHCGKEFAYNSQSIYKLNKDGKTVQYCSYKCWVANDTRRFNPRKE